MHTFEDVLPFHCQATCMLVFLLCTGNYLMWLLKAEYSVHGVYSFISKRLVETLENTPLCSFMFSLRQLCSFPHSCTSSETYQSSEFRCKEKNLFKNMILFATMLPFKIPKSSDLTNLICLCNKRLLSFYKNSFHPWKSKCNQNMTQKVCFNFNAAKRHDALTSNDCFTHFPDGHLHQAAFD